jgi:hypothetical protein
MLVFATSALAIEDDRIRGEVLSVNPDTRMLEIEVLEVGTNVEAVEGSTESYYVSDSVNLEFEIEGNVYNPTDHRDLADISTGDTVLLDFRTLTSGTEIARIRSEETTNMTVRERILAENTDDDDMADDLETDNRYASNDENYRRSALPDSASALPMLGLMGLMFAILAGAIRLYRS